MEACRPEPEPIASDRYPADKVSELEKRFSADHLASGRLTHGTS